MDQTIDNNTTSNPTNYSKKEEKNKGLIAGLIICATIAIAGIIFGIYGLVTLSNKSAEISDLQTQVADQEDVIAMLSDQEAEAEVADDLNTIKQNPIISATKPEFYTINFSQIFGQEETYSISLQVRDGNINSCAIYSIELDHTNGTSIKTSQKLKDCNINGVSGKIYKLAFVGEGHVVGPNAGIAFIMEDGSVDYLLFSDIENSNFNIKGKMKIDGFVVDIIKIGVGNDEYSAGYSSTVFVLSNGEYIKYDSSMLN